MTDKIYNYLELGLIYAGVKAYFDIQELQKAYEISPRRLIPNYTFSRYVRSKYKFEIIGRNIILWPVLLIKDMLFFLDDDNQNN